MPYDSQPLASQPGDAQPDRTPGLVCRIARRVLPDTLFGRLFLTFSLSFLAILVFGAMNATETKTYYLLRGVMGDRVRRMADIALLIDAANAADRARIAERMSVRGFSLDIVPTPPNLEGLTPPQNEDTAQRLHNILNIAIEDLWDADNPESPDYVAPSSEHRQHGIDRASRVHAAVLAINVPGFFDDIVGSLRRALGKRSTTENMPPLYQTLTAIPLADGSWVVFHDDAPGFLGITGVPFKGILFVEMFFMFISLVAFYLIVKPLRRLTQAAENLGRDLPGTPPMPETGPREVREGTQAFNRMQRRIREVVDERSRLLAAVSHDLRTPLTRMRLRVEQLDSKARLALQKDMDDLQQLMDTTIDLARSSSNEGLARVDVAALLESLVEDRQDMGQNVTIDNPENLASATPLYARPLSVKRCLGNLLDNAVRYGGGHVSVSVEDSKTELAILIRDNGPGIPEAQLQRVFEPFFRLEPSRNRGTGGNGLGLAIARSMARMHGGDITLANHPQGGLCARVTFHRNRVDASGGQGALPLGTPAGG